MQKTRWILQTLILSAVLNAVLLLIFFYFIVKSDSLSFAYKTKEEILIKEPPLTSTFLSSLRALNFYQLSELILDQRWVEHGYRVGDFAIGGLASFFDFDVERGLGRGKLSKRIWDFSGVQFLLYPGLEEQDLETLYKFAIQEKWPLTPKGLFHALHQTEIHTADPELINYFCHSPHFILLETLFVRTQLPIQKKELLSLALESGWDWLDAFYKSQHEKADFSKEARRMFLEEALQRGSKMAAHLLIMTDSKFALKTLSDKALLKILDHLEVTTQEIADFLRCIAYSPRSEAVCNKALQLLAFAKKELVDSTELSIYERGIDLQSNVLPESANTTDVRIHIVQSGESLWSISKKYRVSVQALLEENHLQTEIIPSGKSLKIPSP